MVTPFHSARLVFRAVETPEDNDFFDILQKDPLGYANANFSISKPQSKKNASEYQKYVAEEAMLGVIFCLPATDPDTKPTPIGCIHLDALKSNHAQHSHSTIGIAVVPAYQGKGYGGEAIRWILQWAFVSRRLHRVNIGCFGYNPGAKRLYERLGFVLEGCRREFVWFQGQWYDDFELGILASEWRERYGKEEISQLREKYGQEQTLQLPANSESGKV